MRIIIVLIITALTISAVWDEVKQNGEKPGE